jgi:RNA polymerase sigma-70 factor (ECF subfamily)
MPAEVARTLRMSERLELSDAECPSSVSAELIERARAGDHLAFEQIMTTYQHRVVSTAWRMLGNHEDARDAAQEVFLRLFKYLARFRAGEDFSAWLYRININVCRDLWKRRGRSNQLASLETEREFGNLEGLAGSVDVEAQAMSSQQRDIIARALDTLSRKEREALVLRDLEGLSTEEVARILRSSPGTVRSQICTARAKIKQYRDRALKRRRPE